MVIKVNGEPQTLERPLTVAELLVLNRVEMPEMVSVQFNGEFLERRDFSSTTINHNDEVDFLYFMGGGAN
ncbi:MAG: sulfur carrier protein ThiS [Terriglobales bacterium]